MKWFVEAVREGVRPLFEQLLDELTPATPVQVMVGATLLSKEPDSDGLSAPGGMMLAGQGVLVRCTFRRRSGELFVIKRSLVMPCAVLAFEGKLVAILTVETLRSLGQLARTGAVPDTGYQG